MSDPSSLPLPPPLLQALTALSFDTLTPIQAQALPPLLAGRDVIAQARTGSGKTVAFGLGLLSRIDTGGSLQALVLTPTRELADQVGKSLRQLARFLPNLKLSIFCGGVPLRVQVESLVHMPQVVVGTPGRILEHLEKGSLELSALRVLVLDEADRMLDMGFADAIRAVLKFVPRECQTALFSATFPDEIRALSGEIQREPVEVTVDADAPAEIVQRFYEVEPERKLDALAGLLGEHKPESTMIFCNTRRDTQDVAAALDARGYSVLALHGDLEQRDRDEVLVRFANRSCSILVATDVAARGLDIENLPLVVMYDVASDADTHVHRSGRTGRAGRSGLALTLCSARERNRAAVIEERLGRPLRWETPRFAPAKLRTGQLAPMQTLVIDAGRKDKLRPADILGALTGTAGLPSGDVGKISIFDTRAYVAIVRDVADKALQRLRDGKIKGRSFRVRKLV
ncbi:MAG: ATP-dependent RNA helicase DbpA [Rhodanobacteraceae bacterium]|nr:ATP-dependent RNA helicase DbpA [Rhodanobacteraceae bacterium]